MKKIFFTSMLVFLLSSFSVFAAEYSTLWKEESAKFLAEKWIIKMSDDFRTEAPVSRWEILKVIAKLSWENITETCEGKFKDVNTSSWQCKYVEWALGKWYIAKNNTFRPNDKITKTEAVKLLLKVKGIQKVQKSASWQADYMQTAYTYGLIDEKYSDYNASAQRGWIFQIATASIKKEKEIKKKQEERLMSDEV